MQKKKKNESNAITVLIIMLCLLTIIITGEYVIIKDLDAKLDSSYESIMNNNNEIKSVSNKISISSLPEYVVKWAREVLGWGKENEVQFVKK